MYLNIVNKSIPKKDPIPCYYQQYDNLDVLIFQVELFVLYLPRPFINRFFLPTAYRRTTLMT